MGNTQERPSETIDRERKRLVETLQSDSGLLLDALLARGVLTGPEYEALDALPDAERRATENEATTLHAQATGLLRQLAQGPHAPGCPELQIAMRPGVLRTPRQRNPEPSRKLSQSWKLRPLKGLSRSWNPKWILNQSQGQNQSQNWSRSPT
ncbi:nucleolar protein 3 isoform X2 [Phocoena phocoena]|uniref:nucleolar protein 3 isoform X2 n=1 Tax=Phocoena phocoena TaxID=9742 RepID=UPI003306CA98